MCNVAYVSRHSSYDSDGQRSIAITQSLAMFAAGHASIMLPPTTHRAQRRRWNNGAHSTCRATTKCASLVPRHGSALLRVTMPPPRYFTIVTGHWATLLAIDPRLGSRLDLRSVTKAGDVFSRR